MANYPVDFPTRWLSSPLNWSRLGGWMDFHWMTIDLDSVENSKQALTNQLKSLIFQHGNHLAGSLGRPATWRVSRRSGQLWDTTTWKAKLYLRNLLSQNDESSCPENTKVNCEVVPTFWHKFCVILQKVYRHQVEPKRTPSGYDLPKDFVHKWSSALTGILYRKQPSKNDISKFWMHVECEEKVALWPSYGCIVCKSIIHHVGTNWGYCALE